MKPCSTFSFNAPFMRRSCYTQRRASHGSLYGIRTTERRLTCWQKRRLDCFTFSTRYAEHRKQQTRRLQHSSSKCMATIRSLHRQPLSAADAES